MNRAVFLDRDGVINRKARKGEYITNWQEVEFLSGVAEAIALLNSSGFRVIVITNQRCVAKGQISIPELESLHLRMVSRLAEQGANIDAVYYCPHEKEPRCTCRKPAPGMLMSAAHDHGIDLRQSWMIGDSDIDIEAGKAAGCKTVRILAAGETNNLKSDLSADSLLAAVNLVQQRESGYAAIQL
jgi:D-glycero-D-manno-heptose 1,7-bisphosphate phosphatase